MLRKKPETIFQEFFANPRNAHLLFSGMFDAIYSKVGLPIRNQRPLQPDFLQRSRPLSRRSYDGGILDLKLPSEQILQRRRFHPGFGSAVWRAVNQLQDYKRIVAERTPELEAAQRSRMGFALRRPVLTVVIGMRNGNDPDLLRRREEEQLAPMGVQLVTYDDIEERERRRILLQYRLSGGDT